MLTAKVVLHFGGNFSALARAANVTRQAVQQWGSIVPEHTARHLHALHPKLDLREEDYLQAEQIRRERIKRSMRRRRLEAARRAGLSDKKPPVPTPASGA